MGSALQRLHHVGLQKVLLIMGIIEAMIIAFQLFELTLAPSGKISMVVMVRTATLTGNGKSNPTTAYVVAMLGKNSTVSDSEGTPNDYLEEKVVPFDLESDSEQTKNTQSDDKYAGPPMVVSFSFSNKSLTSSISMVRKKRKRRISVYEMKSLFLQGSTSSSSMKRRLSERDQELLSAKSQIMKATGIGNSSRTQASVYRNFSLFMRSYDLMESILKVYIYGEGEQPIFHQPNLGGIYASEGWFMKLLEENKRFVVKDPRKAHLFYIPFSSKLLREAFRPSQPSVMQTHLRSYWTLIARKYQFWNRTEGSDHFIVACHDWTPQFTEGPLQNCIRALCNADVSQGFRIGVDTSLPMTSVRKVDDPLIDVGGKPPSQRPILAFFAGKTHGYLRPKLLRSWENRYNDIKISGPMPRNAKGKQKYIDHMSRSKYCICARGTSVHSPRVVEAILAECVPVIISDNYVPPFFEILDWEAFSIFILERDIPNLRNILVSVSEDRYLAMQQRMKMVQKHFLWHKKPENSYAPSSLNNSQQPKDAGLAFSNTNSLIISSTSPKAELTGGGWSYYSDGKEKAKDLYISYIFKACFFRSNGMHMIRKLYMRNYKS